MPVSPTDKKNSTLKLIAGSKPEFVIGGASDGMSPGKFVAQCEAVEFSQSKHRRGKPCFVPTWEIAEGPFAGAILYQWIPITQVKDKIRVNPMSKYYRYCSMALGRPLKLGDDPDPEKILVGKLCIVSVGYSLKSGRSFSPVNAQKKKYEQDFLRVHEILEIL